MGRFTVDSDLMFTASRFSENPNGLPIQKYFCIVLDFLPNFHLQFYCSIIDSVVKIYKENTISLPPSNAQCRKIISISELGLHCMVYVFFWDAEWSYKYLIYRLFKYTGGGKSYSER